MSKASGAGRYSPRSQEDFNLKEIAKERRKYKYNRSKRTMKKKDNKSMCRLMINFLSDLLFFYMWKNYE